MREAVQTEERQGIMSKLGILAKIKDGIVLNTQDPSSSAETSLVQNEAGK